MSKRNLLVISAIFTCCLFAPPGVMAQGEIAIKPGKYKLTRTTKTNLDTEAVTRTTQECITDPGIDPKSILPDKESCKIKNMELADNKVSFDFSCDKTAEKSAMRGHADYSADDNSISYLFKLEGTFEGRELIVESGGKGEWIGECVPEPEPGK